MCKCVCVCVWPDTTACRHTDHTRAHINTVMATVTCDILFIRRVGRAAMQSSVCGGVDCSPGVTRLAVIVVVVVIVVAMMMTLLVGRLVYSCCCCCCC